MTTSYFRRHLFALALAAITPFHAHATAASDPWWSGAKQDLARQEYSVSRNSQGVQAPNRAQGFRTYFEPDGVRLVRRDTRQAAELLSLRLIGIGRRGGVRAVAAGSVRHQGQRVQIARRGLTEWYENRSDGLEQGFTLQRRPAGDGDVQLILDAGSAMLQQAGANIELTTPGMQRMRYSKLVAWDADGRPLEAAMEAQGRTIRLCVGDADARYPIVIDPLLTAVADAQLESNQTDAAEGASVAIAGDINGDGFDDVIVGAPQFDSGQSNEGVAFIHLGSANGLAAVAHRKLEIDQAGASFGSSVAGAGDVNGDGLADLVIGAKAYDNGEVDEGAMFVFHSSAGGISSSPSTLYESNQADAFFGVSVAGAGDVNGDGFADVIVGASTFDNGQIDEGNAFLFHGSATGVVHASGSQLQSNIAGAYFGISVAGAGDVNRDGFADVIVGAPALGNGQIFEGRVYVYYGGPVGISATGGSEYESNQINAFLGNSVSGAGDVNGDGFADVIVGAQLYDQGQVDEGVALVFHGSASGIGGTAAIVLEADQAGAAFGSGVAGAGDVNGDGYADVVVGARQYDGATSDEGAAFVHFGSSFGVNTEGAVQLDVDGGTAQFGTSVAGDGDFNGDGYADIVVGAPGFANGQVNEGAAFAYHGGARGISGAALGFDANQEGAWLGYSIAGVGDLNADGFDDLVVGLPRYDNGQIDEGAVFVYHGGTNGPTAAALLESNAASANFGFAVSGAGDVDADGYADVVVGAYSLSNGQSGEGAALVYRGSAQGVITTPYAQLEANQANAALGVGVAGVGDTNADGYADIVVGARLFSAGQTDEGAAFVYYGGPFGQGLGPDPDLRIEADQAHANFGSAIAGAGDVNADGYADVLIAAATYDNGQADEGAVFLHLGGPAGVSATPALRIESNQDLAFFGDSIAGAGDINGDGYSDVIIGTPRFSNLVVSGGMASVHLGGPGGLSPISAAVLQVQQAGASFGVSVAAAGDVNGDGYADVIVGAGGFDNAETNEGAAFVYHGSANGLSTVHDVHVESNQVNAILGTGVAGIGDINGDGYADIAIGAPFFDLGQTDEGAFFVYQGNGRGRAVSATQLRGNSRLPRWGRAFQTNAFDIELKGLSPRGRERARVEAEACPAGLKFGAPGCLRSVSSDWTVVTGVSPPGLTVSASGLATNTLYHWRARLQYIPIFALANGITAPPNPRHGPWRRVNANGDVADMRTGNGVLFASGFE